MDMITNKTNLSSQTSLLPSFFQAEEARRFDGIGHIDITQEGLVRAYGKGNYGRAKCPLCGGNHLSVSKDGRWTCFNCHDNTGLYWRFVQDGLLEGSRRSEVNSLYSKGSSSHLSSCSKASIACKTTIDTVYRALFALCPLTPSHQRYLEERKLSFYIDGLSFGSLPDRRGKGVFQRDALLKALLEKTGLSREEIALVPGFYLDKQKKLKMGGTGGLMLSVSDGFGRIVGIQLRSTVKNAKFRYIWLSSAKQGGVLGGAPTGFLAGDDLRSDQIAITEGALKGVVLRQHLNGIKGILHMAGVGMLSQLLERLEELQGVKKALVCFDADWQEKPEVLAALASLIRVLRSHGIAVEIRGWEIAKGKGIDDYLANGHALADTYTVDAEGILRGATLRKRSAYLVSSLLKGSREVPLLPDLALVFQERKEPTLEEMRRFTRLAFVEAINAATGTFTLLDGPTGGGKTTSFVEEVIGGTVYAAANYKQMFEVMEALEKAGRSYRVLFGRGRLVDETADAETQARQQVIWDQAGCKYIERAEVLGAKGHFPCTGCPLFKKDPKERAASCPYWAQRQAAMEVLGSEIVVTLAQTLASNHEVKVSAQSDLFETSKAHTLIFDDIADPLAVLAPTQCVDLDDVEMWAARMLERPGNEEKQRDQAYRALVREVRACLSDPERPFDELYRLGGEAHDFMNREEPHWRMFKVKPEEVPPLNAVGSLALWLARGLSVKFIGAGKQRALVFLRPSPLLNEMPKGRVIWMDATPNKVLMEHLAENIGMRFVDTNLPQPLQNIIQIGDLLWKGDQLDNHPEAAALLKYAKENDALIIRKKARATDGEAYFGRDERGLNAYKDAPFTVLEGHHAMRETDAEQAAWAWGAWSAHCGKPAPFAGAAALEAKTERTFGDAYRPWKRVQHTIADPLAENIVRHHYSTTILQAVARDRDPKKPKFVLSGSPIEYNGKPYPVTLWMKSELQTFLEGKGCVLSKEDREAPEHIQGLNAKRSQEKEQRIGEAVAYLETLSGYEALKTIADVRRRLGGKNKVSGAFAEEVWEALRFGAGVQSAEHLTLNEGGQTETYTQLTSLSVPLDLEDNLLKTNDFEKALFGGSAQTVGRTFDWGGGTLNLEDGSLVEREDLDICTGIPAEADYASDPPPFGLETDSVWEVDSIPVWDADETPVWEEDSALVSVPEPSPISNAETASVSGLDAGVVCLEDVPVFGVVALEDGEAMAERIEERGLWPSEEASWREEQGLVLNGRVRACKTAFRGTEEEVCEAEGERRLRMVCEAAYEGLALGEIESPLPLGEEAANPPPEAKREGLEGGEEKRRRLRGWWVWLGGVEAWRAYEESPSEATRSVLETLFGEMLRYVPDVAPSEMLHVLSRPPPFVV